MEINGELPPYDEVPPAYESQPRPDETALSLPSLVFATYSERSVKPTTLYIVGRFIHPSDLHTPPLYEFSHSIPYLKDSDRKVVMERLEYSLRSNSQVSTRKRHLWDLTHRTYWEMPSYEWQAETYTLRTIGHLGIDTFSPKLLSGAKGYKVFKATKGRDRKLIKHSAKVLFTATPPRPESQVTYEWKNADDQIVAREIVRDDLTGLVVTVEMESDMRDTLAAAWIMRVWQGLAKEKGGTSRPRSLVRSVNTASYLYGSGYGIKP